ncbi:MAG TPA: hypothetical protein VEG44_09075 [Candidatus Acidoferrales bacterium]|nr:hypothetical protein [Candidatus Acidoferrales bacterium]
MSKGHYNQHASIIPHNINQTRGVLYQSARALGDIQAVSSLDPVKIEKRVVRRMVGRTAAKTMWRWLK